MPTLNPGRAILPSIRLREHPLPAPLPCCVAVLPIQCVWELNASPPVLKVALVGSARSCELVVQWLDKGRGEHGDAVFAALGVTHQQLAASEVHVLHPLLQAFSNAKS